MMGTPIRQIVRLAAVTAYALSLTNCLDHNETRGSLTAGARFTRQYLDGETPHRFEVELAAGSALRFEVGQQHVDVEVRIGNGRQHLLVDIPIGRRAPEQVCFIAEEAGRYIIEVAPFTGTGHYSLNVTEFGPAMPEQRSCAEALVGFHRAQIGVADGVSASAELFDRSAVRFERAGETFLAAVARREAASAWVNAGKPERAIVSHERALKLARQAQSDFLEVSVLNRLGLACRDLGDFERAASVFERARERAMEAGDRRGLASALTNLGRLRLDFGDPHTALDHLGIALGEWRSLDDLDEQAQVLIHRGTALGTLDRHEEAADDLERAFALATQAGMDRLRASALQAASWNRYLGGSPTQGLESLEQAISIFRRLGLPNDEAGALDRLGTLRAATGDLEAAVEAYRAALRLLEDDADLRNVAESSVNLGCLLIEKGALDQAAARLDLADAFYASVEDPKSAAQIAYCRARLARHRGALELAIAYVDEALGIVDQLRQQARELGHSYLPIWLWQDYADLGIELRLDHYTATGESTSLERAFETLDRARAWTLFEQVVERLHKEKPAVPGSPRAKIEALKIPINLLAETRRRLRERGTETVRLEQVEANLRRLNLEIEDARAEQRAAARGAGHLGSPLAVSTSEVQRHLPVGSALLAYHLATEGSALFVLTRETLKIWPLPRRGDLEAQAEAFYHTLETNVPADGQWPLIAQSLARQLLPPGAVPETVDRLFLMVDGLLHYVPFAALASPRRSYEVGTETQLLLDDLALSYVPSASVFLALDQRRRNRSPAAETLAVFADPVFALDDGRFQQTEDLAALKPRFATRAITVQRLPDGPLPRLPYTAQEVDALLALAAPEARAAWIGFEANKRAVLEADLSRFRIVHFATHAWIDERLPELSGLVLSRYDPAGRPLDGDLLLHEIQDLDLAADLAVLSGCQTALGKHVRGNGLLGLTQGFFDAGATQVVVTLWSVDDRSAAMLMPVFYEHLLIQAKGPAQALRAAQQWLRRQPGFERPYYWAEFALHGAS